MRFNKEQTALNGICPYFTMFPLEFPLNILDQYAHYGDRVLDPFCGRGTTNFAARLLGLESVGIDSNPVAAAITGAKLIHTTPEDILTEASEILETQDIIEKPFGEFWEWAFHENVLEALCRFRTAFLEECSTPARVALRGVIIGALHGPLQKNVQSYFSNQCPRTYAPKPAYATRFWKKRSLRPREVDVLEIVWRRAKRYFSVLPSKAGDVHLADSRDHGSFDQGNLISKFNWIVTSPPYYGMRTYIPDQWLRHWFVGGQDRVDYSSRKQVAHSSPDDFARDVRAVWRNAALFSADTATLVVRFGGIADRKANPKEIIKSSFSNSGWRISTIKSGGNASLGKRQADTFLRQKSKPIEEYVVWGKRSVTDRS